MHEQSETVRTPYGWTNIYGRALSGQPLPLTPQFAFEKRFYPSEQEASMAAAWRSVGGGDPHEHDTRRSPTYGFSQSYRPSPQASAFGRMLELLNDPRNAWLGLPFAGFRVPGGLAKLKSTPGMFGDYEALRRAQQEALSGAFKETKLDPRVMGSDPRVVEHAGNEASVRALRELTRSMGWTPQQMQTFLDYTKRTGMRPLSLDPVRQAERAAEEQRIIDRLRKEEP